MKLSFSIKDDELLENTKKFEKTFKKFSKKNLIHNQYTM